MKLDDVLKRLQSLGTERNRALFARRGARPPMHGVSAAHLGKLQQLIRRDHALALQLWATRNHDARLLAAQIADPEATTAAQLDGWARDASPALGEAVASLAASGPLAHRCADAWTESKAPGIAAAGWCVLARLAATDPHFSDADLEQWLQTIEQSLRRAPDRTRHAMNDALIAIGLRNAKLAALALASAARLGPVQVDHGDSDCRTPDAAATIRRTLEERRARAHGPLAQGPPVTASPARR